MVIHVRGLKTKNLDESNSAVALILKKKSVEIVDETVSVVRSRLDSQVTRTRKIGYISGDSAYKDIISISKKIIRYV